MKIKPSAKIRRRHLLLEGKKEDIEKAILEYIGILGWAKATPVFIRKEDKIILSIERKSLSDVRAAFELYPEKIRVLKVSGTLKGLGK